MKIKKILLLTLFLILPFAKVEAQEVTINVFYGDGCPHCAKEDKYLNVLKKELGDNIEIEKYEVWNNKENNNLLKEVRTTLNDDNEGVPFVVIGNKYFNGYNDDIAKDIKKTIFDNIKQNSLNVVKLIKNDKIVPSDVSLKTNPTIHFSIMKNQDAKKANASVIALTEGMSDAINLGSLWVLLFLGGILLSIYNKKKRWILGSIFILTSTITYMILALTNIEFTLNQTTFIRSFISIICIIIAAISIDAHLKINLPKKSILQILQELFGKKQMLLYAVSIIIASIITTFALVNQANSSPALFRTLLEIQNIEGISYVMNIILYFFSYLITSLILFAVLNTIIKEVIIENTIGTYNRLIAGIVILIAAFILLYLPGAFLMSW